MKLVGMLDSPYVRRVALALDRYGVPFEHSSLSVFRQYDEFVQVNPVVKAPTLVLDDGTVVMDSTLILDYFEHQAAPQAKLLPALPAQRAADLRCLGLALAACEKAVQLVYESNLRPAEKQHQPWVDRVDGQLLAACDALDEELSRRPPLNDPNKPGLVDITSVVAWSFIGLMLPEQFPGKDFPALRHLAEALENTRLFQRHPMR